MGSRMRENKRLLLWTMDVFTKKNSIRNNKSSASKTSNGNRFQVLLEEVFDPFLLDRDSGLPSREGVSPLPIGDVEPSPLEVNPFPIVV